MPLGPAFAPRDTAATSLAVRFRSTRALTLDLVAPLAPEDFAVQSMPDASPAKWHLAHTSWFFEQFVLAPHLPGYRAFDERFTYLFNSYYESVGPRHRRPDRGLLTRPTIEEVRAYRAHINEWMERWFGRPRAVGRLGTSPARSAESNVTTQPIHPEHAGRALEVADVEAIIELGINHEQQHQELLLTDIKHLFSCNPIWPAYTQLPAAHAREGAPAQDAGRLAFDRFTDGIYEIGHASPGHGEAEANDFCFDNETPRHRVYLNAFALADRLITNAEYRDFIRGRGYERPELWLSDGWATVQSQDWMRPIYWSESLESEFTLGGERELAPDAPVCHVSFYEADAFARWAQMRLPSEAEWEVAAHYHPIRGNLLRSGAPLDGSGRRTSSVANALHPRPASPATTHTHTPRQLFGDVWEWTSSPYSAYPGFTPLAGTLGEYNGKFMANQFVLRGGSCATPASHIRATYRNFFYPHARWQFSGIRLARGAAA